MGASKISGKVAEVGWKFGEIASQKVNEVSGTVSLHFTVQGVYVLESRYFYAYFSLQRKVVRIFYLLLFLSFYTFSSFCTLCVLG